MELAVSSLPRLAAVCLAVVFSSAGHAQPLVIRGGSIFSGTGDRMHANTGIVVVNGRLMEVGANLEKRELESARVIDLGDDDYILPGIFDLHAHYNMTLNEIRREETEVTPVIYLANGVTSTFPAGAFDPMAMLECRARIDRGEQPGPRIFNSGPYFGPARPGWDPDMPLEQIRAEVDRWAELGVAGFKAKRISAPHLQALIDRAHRHGLTVTAHLDSGYNDTVNPRDAIHMGIDRVEHFLGGDAISADKPAYDSLVDVRPDTPEFKRIAELFVRHGVFFDPTLTAYGYYGDRGEVFEQWSDERSYFTPYTRELTKERRQRIEQFGRIYETKLRTIKAFYDLGGADLIVLGTDHASVGEYLAGFSAHRELHAIVLAGIPEAVALRIATINGARALNVGDRLGSIEVGKWADLIVIRGNPLEDIRNTRRVRIVIKGGEVYEPQALLEPLLGKLGPRGAEEVIHW